ncbi:MAG: PEP-CTERM sorting domain-containing protein, partial [bacterium]
VSEFSLVYTSATSVHNIPDKFAMTAYSDNNMINLLGSVVGPYNWGTIDELVLNYDNIMVVKIIGAQGHYTVDDITYSLMSPVPEPSTLLLIGLGIAIVFGVNRKKYNLKIT